MTAATATDDVDTRRDKRRRAILDAARALFLEKGYGATTLNDIVGRSGGSLATLYELFGNKHGLLRAMVEEICARMAAVIESATLGNRKPAEALREIADHMFDKLNDAEGIALFRVIVAESPRHPELGQLFYAAGPAVGRSKVADYLAEQTARGVLAVDDPETAASMFFDMVFGKYHMQLLCGLPIRLTEAEKKRHLDRVIAAFMRICYAE